MPHAFTSVDAQLDEILALAAPLPELEVTLLDAHGCVLAEDVVAQGASPPVANAALDGYAVRAVDLAGASPTTPVRLPVVADLRASSAEGFRVMPGLSIKLAAGVPLPAGADTVIPAEWTDGGTDDVILYGAAPRGAYVRPPGEDVLPGSVVLAAGTHLGAAQIALLASIGWSRVHVRPRPRCVILSTGSELTDIGGELAPGQVFDANSYGLAAAAKEAGAFAFRVGIVPDDPDRLADAIEDQLVRADVVVTSGGLSHGDDDVLAKVVNRLGDVRYQRMAMTPGVNQAFGTVGSEKVPFFGLPGSPAAALISFEVFVRPALRAMLGATAVHRPRVRARLTRPITSRAGRRHFVRGRLDVHDGQYVVTPVDRGAVHLLSRYATTNALVVVPEEVADLEAGMPVSVMLLERRQG